MREIEGVSGALIVDGKILIVRRSLNDDFLPGYYELPGGSLEPGETKGQALIREFHEELSLKIKILKKYHEYTYQPGPNTHCSDYGYIVALDKGENSENLKLSDEHDKYKWVGVEDLDLVSPISSEAAQSLKLALKKK
jgi:8-oxo-dGTP diphosphatase